MAWELTHPLAPRGRDLPNRAERPFDTVRLVVHRSGPDHFLVSLMVTDHQGNQVKDSRLGECWVPAVDHVGRPQQPYRLLQAALEVLLAQPGARLLPETTDTPA